MIRKYNASEYARIIGDDVSDYMGVLYVYELEDSCYLGFEMEDGTYMVVGLGRDRFVDSYEELCEELYGGR